MTYINQKIVQNFNGSHNSNNNNDNNSYSKNSVLSHRSSIKNPTIVIPEKQANERINRKLTLDDSPNRNTIEEARKDSSMKVIKRSNTFSSTKKDLSKAKSEKVSSEKDKNSHINYNSPSSIEAPMIQRS